MSLSVDCFFVYSDHSSTQKLVDQCRESSLVNRVYVLAQNQHRLNNCEVVVVEENNSCSTIRLIAKMLHAEFALLALDNSAVEVGQGAIERLVQVAEFTDAPMVYADYMESKGGVL